MPPGKVPCRGSTMGSRMSAQAARGWITQRARYGTAMNTPRAAASAVAPIERSFIVPTSPWIWPGFPDEITPTTAVPITAPNHPGWNSLNHLLPDPVPLDVVEGVWTAIFRSSSDDELIILSNHSRTRDMGSAVTEELPGELRTRSRAASARVAGRWLR